jgi:SAM-dependent methyltransferase
MEKIAHIDNVPENVSFLADTPNFKIDLTEIDIFYDKNKQHSTISNFQKNGYYEEYLMTTTYSSSMQNLQAEQITKLKHLVGLAKNKEFKFGDEALRNFNFIEIGCGDGSFMQHASKFFTSVVGIEPSKKFWRICVEKKLEVINDFLTSDKLLTDKKFDAFASRQVFEHLENPRDVLIGIKRILNEGAIGFIEVPNGYKALKNGNFYEFFPDHINYFSINSLSSVANEVGFNIIECKETFNTDYIEIWLRNDPDIGGENQQFSLTKSKVDLALKNFAESRRSNKKSIFFGCGAKAISLVASNPDFFSSIFQFAIDSDPHKIGKFIPNTAIEILSISDPRLLEYSEVLILALSYQNEISNLIQEKLQQVTSVYSIDEKNALIPLFST